MSDFIPNIIKVDLDADIQKQFDSASPKGRSRISRQYILDNLRGVYNSSDGKVIIITGKTARKFASIAYEPKMRITPYLVDALQNAVFEYISNSDKLRDDDFDKFAYYSITFDIGGKLYKALLNIGIDKNNKWTLYDINPMEEI